MTLKQWRESKGWGLREAGRQLGVTHVWLHQLESGRVSPTMRTADKIERLTEGAVTRLDWPKETV